MKCPKCWAEKAYLHPLKGWKGILLDCLLLTHMKCHHCYHKFTIPWFFTFGKEVTRPKSPPASPAMRARRPERRAADAA